MKISKRMRVEALVEIEVTLGHYVDPTDASGDEFWVTSAFVDLESIENDIEADADLRAEILEEAK